MKFPVSILMKEEFVCHYNNNDFDKLIIQYYIKYKNLAAHVCLICTAMNKMGKPMHKNPIYLRSESSALKRILSPFILGNLELKKGFLEKFMKDEEEEFLLFKAFKNPENYFYYIGFKISSKKMMAEGDRNPCPWDCPDDANE